MFYKIIVLLVIIFIFIIIINIIYCKLNNKRNKLYNFVEKNKYKIIISLIIFFILTIFFDIIIRRNIRRYIYSKQAVMLSLNKNKKLLVVGDPLKGSFSSSIGRLFYTYPCGDILGCDKCINSVKSDLYEYLKKQKTNSLVIFISGVLEYVDDIEKSFNEIKRVSGGDFKIVFIDNILDNKYLNIGSYFEGDKYFNRKYIINYITNNEINYTKLK